MTQQGLIKKIVATAGLENCRPNWTPASQLALGSDPEGAIMDEEWSYSSVVGMLLYLSTNTRPDIAFAVSQVARFSQSPRQVHAVAIKTIVRYLHGTSKFGIIMKPTGKFQVDCYCDADFAGLYKREPDWSPTATRSRTGYMIFLGSCTLVWKSQLQTEISLSTLEAEYSALSNSLRTVVILRQMLLEIGRCLNLENVLNTAIRCRVFKDNNGAFSLATNHRITNRTKYFLVKFHWFWHHVTNGEIEVFKVDTTEQIADYLTKGLPRETFEKLRRLAQGW